MPTKSHFGLFFKGRDLIVKSYVQHLQVMFLFFCHLYDMVFYQNDIKLYLSKDFLRALLNNQKLEKVVSDSSAGKSKKTGSDEGANMSISAFMFDCSAKHPLDDFLSTGSSKLTKQSQSPKVAQDGCEQQKFMNSFT